KNIRKGLVALRLFQLLSLRRTDSVNQPTRVQTASEHEMVKLHCTYSTSDSYPYLYWYQHKTNGFLVYMLRKLSTGSSSSEKEFEERFHADLNKSSSSVSLSIQDVRVSDSAVYHSKKEIKRVDLVIFSAAVSDSALYYCALQPTVSGNSVTMCKNLIYRIASITQNRFSNKNKTVTKY
uniref:Ig-like domain-containing protein n=1 Tax=Sinocyclocheilus rhinocerous TaxID=307959 RepID=A0A673LYC2_9TELE